MTRGHDDPFDSAMIPSSKLLDNQNKEARSKLIDAVTGDIPWGIEEFIERLEADVKPRVQETWSDHFYEKPVDVVTFCRDWLKMPLYPIQEQEARVIWGDDPTLWRGPNPFDESGEHPIVNEADECWGKGSGKNTFISGAVFCYAAYKLTNMRNPQVFFGKTEGDNIDLVNVSINARQAKTVFFQQVKNMMRKTKDPATGQNWFTMRGLDIREGGANIQGRIIYLNGSRNIALHSCDSKEYTGEGLNILMSLFDEFGSFPHPAKALALMDALKETSVSRFKELALAVAISYVYSKNDAMQLRIGQAKKNPGPKTRVRELSTFEVNPTAKEEAAEFSDIKRKNPERYDRVYRGILRATDDLFFSMPEEIRARANWKREWPTVGDKWWTDNLQTLKLKEWFQGMPGRPYWVHIDLAKGKVRGDKVGFALGHTMWLKPTYSEEYQRLMKMEDTETNPMPGREAGVFFNLLLQIRAPQGGEVRLADLIEFVTMLRDTRGFDIQGISYDGWQSLGEQQRARAGGFESVEISADKTTAPADLLKELVYSGRADYLPHLSFMREAEELQVMPDGKVDHPEQSRLRDVEEGEPAGSKDVWDAAACVAWKLIGELDGDEGGQEGGGDKPFAM